MKVVLRGRQFTTHPKLNTLQDFNHTNSHNWVSKTLVKPWENSNELKLDQNLLLCMGIDEN